MSEPHFPDRRRRSLTRLAMLLPAAFLLSTFVAPALPPPLGGPGRSLLIVSPVALQESDPAIRRAGRLLFLRGWSLESPDRRFGGISAIQVDQDGLVALSDTGILFRFAIPSSPGRVPLDILPLFHRQSDSKAAHDSEAMLLHRGQAWIAFERDNRIARFDASRWRQVAVAEPAPMRNWGSNSGPEAMVRLRDGRFLVFAEGRSDRPPSQAILFSGDPTSSATRAEEFRYRGPDGHRVTDAALLPDGKVLLLHRRVTLLGGASATLSILDPATILAGEVASSSPIAVLRSPLTVDNMEALSVAREDGKTVVRVASDNNFMAIQRSLLLEFELQPAK